MATNRTLTGTSVTSSYCKSATVLLGIFKSINDAFNQFNETLSDTGSVGEAIKVREYQDSLVLFLFHYQNYYLKLIGFVAKKCLGSIICRKVSINE